MTDEPRTPVLVLGLGNLLCTDDGAGVAAVRRLIDGWELPGEVQAVDGGTLGLSLLPLVDSADEVILVDAIRGDGPAGSLLRLEGDEVGPAVYERLSVHQIGVADLLAGAALVGRYPRRVVLLGVVPASLELGVEPTPAVAASIDGLVDGVVAELRAMGHTCRPRASAPGGP
ncbi:MAG TPA: hydrogenase maturation protease [Kofleriaceae bacterium]|nr:hydrogenase maturation protease [Kofleriaceae bacterium]